MRISKQKLKLIILEEFENLYETDDDGTKVRSGVKSGGTFAQDRKDDALDVNPEISNTERAILAQIDKFLLGIAAIEGVELNNNRPQIEQILKLLKTRIADKAVKQGQGEQK